MEVETYLMEVRELGWFYQGLMRENIKLRLSEAGNDIGLALTSFSVSVRSIGNNMCRFFSLHSG